MYRHTLAFSPWGSQGVQWLAPVTDTVWAGCTGFSSHLKHTVVSVYRPGYLWWCSLSCWLVLKHQFCFSPHMVYTSHIVTFRQRNNYHSSCLLVWQYNVQNSFLHACIFMPNLYNSGYDISTNEQRAVRTLFTLGLWKSCLLSLVLN